MIICKIDQLNLKECLTEILFLCIVSRLDCTLLNFQMYWLILFGPYPILFIHFDLLGENSLELSQNRRFFLFFV